MGSVKNLSVQKKATPASFGSGVFEFTDDYSVFDYGKMPQTVEHKGEALCRMAAYNFEQLQKRGIRSHYERLLKGNQMQVKLVQVLFPQKNEIKTNSANYLIPLELIFRNSLPKGSSVFKRLERGETTYQQLGLKTMPVPGERLEKAILDVSTKLEETDRYMNWKEAGEMAKLTSKELDALQQSIYRIDDFLNEKAESVGLEHADGKVEFALGPKRELMLVDVCGTLDENRFLFDGMHISKQVLRDYYNTTPWAKQIDEAKAAKLPKERWPKPSPVPGELMRIVSDMYTSVCEAWIGKRIWNAPTIEETMESYQSFLGD